MSEALRIDLGQTHRAAKTLMKWTGASEKSAKNWLCGTFAPSGHNLVCIMRESETVFRTILRLSRRESVAVTVDLIEARAALSRALRALEALPLD